MGECVIHAEKRGVMLLLENHWGLTTTAAGAATGAGAASAPAIHAELRIKNVAFTVEPPRGKGGRVVVWRRTIAPLVPVLPRGKSC